MSYPELKIRVRCFEIRIKCRRDNYSPTKEEHLFLKDYFQNWPEDYNLIGEEAFKLIQPDWFMVN